jgi:formylglycine-generating enzyme required for sulfatase activity
MKPPRAQVARADLLRALALDDTRQHLTLSAGAQHWFGYRQVPAERRLNLPTDMVFLPESKPAPEPPTSVETTAEPARTSLRMEHAWLVKAQPVEAPAPRDPAAPALEPLDEAATAAQASQPQGQREDLLPWARLMPVLRRYLSQSRMGGVDVAALWRHLAEQHSLRRLPRVQRSRWNPDLVVVLDFRDALWPYRRDMHRLCQRLLGEVGRTGLSLRVMTHGPTGGWTDWLEEQTGGPRVPEVQPWTLPAPGSCVLLVSDMGLFGTPANGPASPLTQRWLRWVAQQQQAQVTVLGLAPLGADQLRPEVCRRLPVLRWSPDGRLHPERVAAPPSAEPAGLAQLLAMVAVTRRVDPPLMRALRRLNPVAPLHAGLEGAAWNHPHTQGGRVCTLLPQHQVGYLARFRLLPTRLHEQQDALRRRHHAHSRALLVQEENLLHAVQARLAWGGGQPPGEVEQAALLFFRRLVLTVQRADAVTLRNWLPAVQACLSELDALTAHAHRQVFSELLAAVALRRGQAAQALPGWMDVAAFQAAEGALGPAVQAYLVQDLNRRRWLIQPQPPAMGQNGRPLAPAAQVVVKRQGPAGQEMRVLRLASAVHDLAGLDEVVGVEVNDGRQVLRLVPVTRPRGILGWSQNQALELTVVLPEPHRGETRISEGLLIPNRPEFALQEKQRATLTVPLNDFGIGIDEFGSYLDLKIPSKRKNSNPVIQRFRWIEPGSFWMGSSLSEREVAAQQDEKWLKWMDAESPRHYVKMNQGFWLADTVCTQELWLAVVGGNNPSHFKSNNKLPVEQVSWDDAMEIFMPKLQEFLPSGVEAVLPSEAQWEYACRAGTETAYNWGHEPSAVLANMAGSVGGTSIVKSYPSNLWGFFDMHGNVWEWCIDKQRWYTEEEIIDPLGAIGNGQHALRGGSWNFSARDARSAFRYLRAQDWKNNRIGFRVALRFKPSQGR